MPDEAEDTTSNPELERVLKTGNLCSVAGQCINLLMCSLNI